MDRVRGECVPNVAGWGGEGWSAPLALEAAILAHAEREAPNEACGLIVACFGQLHYRPMRNAEQSPMRFRIDPREQFEALWEIHEDGHELVGIAHSHPRGTVEPSESDLAYARGWPNLAHLICAEGVIRAYTASGEPL